MSPMCHPYVTQYLLCPQSLVMNEKSQVQYVTYGGEDPDTDGEYYGDLCYE
jgi:hypothetical protein